MSKKTFIYGFESLFGGPDEGMPQGETPVITLERSSEEYSKPKTKRRRKPRVTANAVADNEKQDRRSSSKNFISGLDSLFMDALTDAFEEDIEPEAKEPETKAKPKKPKAKRSSSVALDVPVQPAIEKKEALVAMTESIAEPVGEQVRERRAIRPRKGGGLDFLIRQTSEETFIEYQSESKRVTFVFDKNKLARLKVIAKSKKLFLKDIIGDVVSKFIDEYENSNTDLN